MASGGSVYSQTLLRITHTKLSELAKKRSKFEDQRRRTLAGAELEEDGTEKVRILTNGLKACFSISTSKGRVIRGASNNPRLELDLKNLDRFLAQARYDPSVSPAFVDSWQYTLLRHFEVQSLKFDFASLYGQLTTEWLSAKQKSAAKDSDDVDMKDFEHVSAGKKLESRRKWEESVFEPVHIDHTAMREMLHHLFGSAPNDSKHLPKAIRVLRDKVEEFGRGLVSPGNFNQYSLGWTIKGLLASDLLDNEKREVLRDFLSNTTILNEVADVLNMRMMALADWSWGDEVVMEQRRQLNGTYNIYMHEDLLEAIFLQYIGVRWSVFWKSALNKFRQSPGVWKSSKTSISLLDQKRRQFYLGVMSEHSSVCTRRLAMYRSGYFLSNLLDDEEEERANEEGDEEACLEESAVQTMSKPRRTKQTARRAQAPRVQMASRKVVPSPLIEAEMEDEMEEELDKDDDDQYKPKNAMEAKQSLLHLLSTEILMETRLNGELTCFRSQVDALYPSLPHSTIDCVLSFLGVSEDWLQFFSRFLKAPLRFSDEESSTPRQRQTGTPGSHVLSEVFGEIVLFCLDFQINQSTEGELLWRTNDDFWFWSSSQATCSKSWSIIEKFMSTTGLKLNEARTGAARMSRDPKNPSKIVSLDLGETLPRGQIRWGMLYLNPDSGRFEIDQKMVDNHIDELNRQLQDKTNNIFGWIQAWNSYAATFFTSNFGKPANCFGRQHVDNMLATHERIQRQVFASSSSGAGAGADLEGRAGGVLGFLKQAIKQRFGVENIPDGYFYFPAELGGLEVRNPFIGLLQLRETVHEDPAKLIDEFLEAEKDAYKYRKDCFDRGQLYKPPSSMLDPEFKPDNADVFFSFEEFIKYREEFSYGFENELAKVFPTLLKRPEEESIDTDHNGEIKMALNSLGSQSGLRGILANWYSMEPYWKWVAQLYGPGMISKFGGLNIVDPGLLPMGMVSLFRSGRVNWQE